MARDKQRGDDGPDAFEVVLLSPPYTSVVQKPADALGQKQVGGVQESLYSIVGHLLIVCLGLIGWASGLSCFA